LHRALAGIGIGLVKPELFAVQGSGDEVRDHDFALLVFCIGKLCDKIDEPDLIAIGPFL